MATRFTTAPQDNATGCGMLLELARAWAALPQKPRRSALFISVAAEEAGLLGSEYYGQHPVIPAGKTALAHQLRCVSAVRPHARRGRPRRGAHHRLSAGRRSRPALPAHAFLPIPRPLAGHVLSLRSFFVCARRHSGVFRSTPAKTLIGKPPGTGKKLADEYNEAHYHQPSDEYHDDWDFSGMELYARFGFLIDLERRQPAQASHLARRRRISAAPAWLAEYAESGEQKA